MLPSLFSYSHFFSLCLSLYFTAHHCNLATQLGTLHGRNSVWLSDLAIEKSHVDKCLHRQCHSNHRPASDSFELQKVRKTEQLHSQEIPSPAAPRARRREEVRYHRSTLAANHKTTKEYSANSRHITSPPTLPVTKIATSNLRSWPPTCTPPDAGRPQVFLRCESRKNRI